MNFGGKVDEKYGAFQKDGPNFKAITLKISTVLKTGLGS